jgi:hypothetical protein
MLAERPRVEQALQQVAGRIGLTVKRARAEDSERTADRIGVGTSLRVPAEPGLAHYRVLLNVANDDARGFYEIEAARESWSSRELERQVGALLLVATPPSRSPSSRRLDQVARSLDGS